MVSSEAKLGSQGGENGECPGLVDGEEGPRAWTGLSQEDAVRDPGGRNSTWLTKEMNDVC